MFIQIKIIFMEKYTVHMTEYFSIFGDFKGFV